MQSKCWTEDIESNSCLRLRKLEKSFEDVLRYSNNFCVDSLLHVQNIYQKILNMEMVYHVTWVMLIKSTLFVETAVIKKIHTSKQSKNE